MLQEWIWCCKTSSPNLGNANVLQCCQEVHGYVLKLGSCSSKELCVTKKHFWIIIVFLCALKTFWRLFKLENESRQVFRLLPQVFANALNSLGFSICDVVICYDSLKKCGFILFSSNCMFLVVRLSDVALPPAPQAPRKLIWGEGCIGSSPEFPRAPAGPTWWTGPPAHAGPVDLSVVDLVSWKPSTHHDDRDLSATLEKGKEGKPKCAVQ